MDESKETCSKAVKERIAQLRLQKGVSERELSMGIGKGHTYIADMNFRSFNPSLDTLLAICDYFEITPSEFFDEENKNPNVARSIISELQRLLGKDYERLPDLLSQFTESDIEGLKRIYKKITDCK